ncbi:hypothetical protein H5410_027729 [Solanum commersonii]|uniref:Polyprotein protein n=1 Tax=Solanum commersonii TaxID=4109 RepID=A0A9J5Z221_SOLCO|nr:hypothetical protein H5410_027729 [Solanum commersonii]
MIPTKSYFPTPASGPSGTPAPPTSSSLAFGAFATSQLARITQAMILKMGHLAHSTDVRVTRLEVVVPGMIEISILAALTPLRASIDTLTSRVETSETEGAPATFAIHLTTIGDVQRDDITFDVVETSLRDTTMVGSSGADTADVTLGTNPQDWSDALGIDAQ